MQTMCFEAELVELGFGSGISIREISGRGLNFLGDDVRESRRLLRHFIGVTEGHAHLIRQIRNCSPAYESCEKQEDDQHAEANAEHPADCLGLAELEGPHGCSASFT